MESGSPLLTFPLLCTLACGAPDLTSRLAWQEHLKSSLQSICKPALSALSHLHFLQPWHNCGETSPHDFLISTTSWDSVAGARSVLCDQCFLESTSRFNQNTASPWLREGLSFYFFYFPPLKFCLCDFSWGQKVERKCMVEKQKRDLTVKQS